MSQEQLCGGKVNLTQDVKFAAELHEFILLRLRGMRVMRSCACLGRIRELRGQLDEEGGDDHRLHELRSSE